MKTLLLILFSPIIISQHRRAGSIITAYRTGVNHEKLSLKKKINHYPVDIINIIYVSLFDFRRTSTRLLWLKLIKKKIKIGTYFASPRGIRISGLVVSGFAFCIIMVVVSIIITIMRLMLLYTNGVRAITASPPEGIPSSRHDNRESFPVRRLHCTYCDLVRGTR